MPDTIKSIRLSSRHFLLGTLLSRMTGMARDMSMAYAFGIQPSTAAFMVAFRLAHLLRRLFGEGALQSAFIPEFEALRHQSERQAVHFFRQLTLSITLLLIMLIGVGGSLLMGLIWWVDLSPDNREVAVLTLGMLPSLLFICLFGLNSSFLQCQKNYFIPAIAPVAFNTIWIIAVLNLRHLPAQEAMPWLAVGVVLACLCQWLITLPHTWKGVASLAAPTRLSFKETLTELRPFLRPLSLGIFGVAAAQINHAVDTLFARYAEPEGPAFLWYAIRLQQLPLALFGIAIAGALLPPLARARRAQRTTEYHHFLQDALYRTWLYLCPLTAALCLLGEAGVRVVYGRGDFGPEAVLQTTHCLWAYGAGLLPAGLILILAPASYAQNNYHLPSLASSAALALNVLLNSLFIMGWGWGAVSIALATSLSAWMNCCWLGWRLHRMGTVLASAVLLKKVTWVTLITGVTLGEAYWCKTHTPMLFFLSKSLPFSSLLEQIALLGVEIALFGALGLANAGLYRGWTSGCAYLRQRLSPASMTVSIE